MRYMSIVKWLLSIGAICLVLIISLLVYRWVTPDPVFFTTSSPRGTYTIELSGRKERAVLPISQTVHFSTLKNGKPLLSNKYLHSGDWLDPSFEILYPDHRWVGENILKFYREENSSKGSQDSIVISNQTGKVINYLRVTSNDLFLLFDVQPGSETKLSVSPSMGDLRWISVEGELSEKQSIAKNGVDFIIPKGLNGPFLYNIYITEEGTAIESTQLEKYKN